MNVPCHTVSFLSHFIAVPTTINRAFSSLHDLQLFPRFHVLHYLSIITVTTQQLTSNNNQYLALILQKIQLVCSGSRNSTVGQLKPLFCFSSATSAFFPASFYVARAVGQVGIGVEQSVMRSGTVNGELSEHFIRKLIFGIC